MGSVNCDGKGGDVLAVVTVIEVMDVAVQVLCQQHYFCMNLAESLNFIILGRVSSSFGVIEWCW